MPAGPSIMTSRASCSVSPTSAIFRHGCPPYGDAPLTKARTHSAPNLVLPAPRPPSISHVVHGCPPLPFPGGSWCRCAKTPKSVASRIIFLRCRGSLTIRRVRPARDKLFNLSRKFVTERIDVGWHVIVWSIGGNGAVEGPPFFQTVGGGRLKSGRQIRR